MDSASVGMSRPAITGDSSPSERVGRAQARPASAAGQFNQGLRRAGTPSASVSGGDQWRYLLTLICSEYAYCTMHGVDIVDGNIVRCANIQRSLTFGPSPADAPSEPAFDEYWQALQALCGRIRNGHLTELRFSRGRPVGAKTSEGARRFKRLVKEREAGPGSTAV